MIDANSPADVLESFHVCSSHLLCIASVPGAKEDDYKVDEELNKLIVEESELREREEAHILKKNQVNPISHCVFKVISRFYTFISQHTGA